MSDLFDLEAMGEQMESLRHLVLHPAWEGFFKPHLMRARNNAMTMLVNPSEARRAEMSDDFLRARIMTLDELLTLGPSTIEEWDREVAIAAADSQYEQSVQERADLGHMAPLPEH